MDYNSFCGAILNLNPKVRYAGVYNTVSSDVYEKFAKEIERLFTKEQTKKTLTQAYMRWKTRESFAEISGKPIFQSNQELLVELPEVPNHFAY